MKNYYVYVLLDPSKKGIYSHYNIKFQNKPFYVGYGKGIRWREHYYPSHWIGKNKEREDLIRNLIKKGYPPLHIKVYDNLLVDRARLYEIDLISKIGIDNLTNITKGGEISNNGGRSVAQYTLNGRFIKKHRSLKGIRSSLGIIVPSKIVDTDKTRSGYLWRSIFDKNNIPLKINGINLNIRKKATIKSGKKNSLNKNRNMSVHMYDINGNYKKSFSNKSNAEKIFGRLHINENNKIMLHKKKFFFVYGYMINDDINVTKNLFINGISYTNNSQISNIVNRKRIVGIDENKNIKYKFNSVKSSENMFCLRSIRRALSIGKKYKGLYWIYV